MSDKRTFIIGGSDADRKRSKAAMAAFYETLDMSKKYRLTIEPYVRKRTTNQNSLYWSWMTLIADETGNDKDDVHEFLLAKFCPVKEVTIGDEVVERASTKLLDTKEMSRYMNRILPWAAEFGIVLPFSEDQGR